MIVFILEMVKKIRHSHTYGMYGMMTGSIIHQSDNVIQHTDKEDTKLHHQVSISSLPLDSKYDRLLMAHEIDGGYTFMAIASYLEAI